MTRKLLISVILSTAICGVSAHAHLPTVGDLPSPSDAAGERVEFHVGTPDAPVRLAQSKISASKAKSIALREVPGGEVVDISRQGNVYRVRVVARSGRVVDVRVDASTGRVVG